jgi:hypothetical protein
MTEGTGTGEQQAEATGGGAEPGQAGIERPGLGKLLSPERRRCAVSHACTQHGTSERRACRLVNQPRGTQRYRPTQRADEDALTREIIGLASQLWPLWLPPDHGAASAGWLAGRQRPGGTPGGASILC